MPTNPTTATDATSTTVGIADRWLELQWGTDGLDGADASRFHHRWLRDNCPEQRHSQTQHRVAETSLIPADLRPVSATFEDGVLTVTWPDGHDCRFTEQWLRRHDYSAGVRPNRRPLTLWEAADVADLPRADYLRLCAEDDVRREFLEGFARYGVGLLSGVPCEPGTVASVGARFGQVRSTSWGTVFDVRSMTDANSIAFTGLALVTHTDEGYREPAPTIQLQHFLQVDTTGGEATLVDGFAVASELRRTDPAAFELLVRTPLQFHFRDDTTELDAEATTIELDARGDLRRIRYSNHSVQPFLLSFEAMDDFYSAYQAFGRLRESSRFRAQLPMGAGDLYLVDNERVLHGRTALLSGGARHLQSCYIERDELLSGLAVLQRDR